MWACKCMSCVGCLLLPSMTQRLAVIGACKKEKEKTQKLGDFVWLVKKFGKADSLHQKMQFLEQVQLDMESVKGLYPSAEF